VSDLRERTIEHLRATLTCDESEGCDLCGYASALIAEWEALANCDHGHTVELAPGAGAWCSECGSLQDRSGKWRAPEKPPSDWKFHAEMVKDLEAELEAIVDPLREIREKASALLDSLVLGHPLLPDEWERLIILCGRYCSPFKGWETVSIPETTGPAPAPLVEAVAYLRRMACGWVPSINDQQWCDEIADALAHHREQEPKTDLPHHELLPLGPMGW